MKRIGSLKNNYLSLHVNIRIRHRNQSLEQYYKNLACGYLPPPGVLKLLKTPFILLESDDRLFAYRVYNRRILSFWTLYLPILERDYEIKLSIPNLGYVDLK